MKINFYQYHLYLSPLLLNFIYLVNLPYTNLLEILIFSLFLFFLKKHSFKDFLSTIKQISYSMRIPVFLILSGIVLSTLLNQNYFSGLGILKSWFILPIIYSLMLQFSVKKNLLSLNSILKTIYYSGTIISLVSFFYLISGNLTFDGRLRAFYLSPNHLAMIISPSVIISTFYVSKLKKDKTKQYYLYLAITALMLSTLYFTFSYGAWLAVLSSVSIAHLIKNFHFKNFFKYFLIGGFILTALFILISPTDKFQDLIGFDERSSTSSRIIIWKSAFKMIDNNFYFGIGPGNFQETYLKYQKYFPPYLEWAVPHPHNIFLTFWLYSGIVGLIGFICLIYISLKELFTKINPSWINLSLITIIFSILIHGLIETPIWKNDLAIIFWVIFSVINTKK